VVSGELPPEGVFLGGLVIDDNQLERDVIGYD